MTTEVVRGAGAVRRWPFLLRLAIAFAAGWIASFSMPPLAAFPALLAFSILFVLVRDAATWRSVFALCWAYVFTFHLVGLSWVGEAFLVDAARYGWMRPFIVSGLPALLAFVVASACALFAKIRCGRPLTDVLAFVALFMVGEWLRGHVLTGFPWNLPVQAFDRVLPVLQGAAWIGPYGVSLAVLLAAAAVGAGLAAGSPLRRATRGLVLLLPLAAIAIGGMVRLSEAPETVPSVPGVKLRLIQPNIPQLEKWRRDLMGEHFERHLDLMADARSAGITHVIWPEAATPFSLMDAPDAVQRVAAVTPPEGVTLVGTPRRFTAPDGSEVRHANALAIVTAAGTIAAAYDKHHLVPLGEYVPLREYLPLEKLAQGHGSFTPGPGPRSVTAQGLPPFSPLICYEVIFPGDVIVSDARPRWLLNLTNDAWFGSSAGPHQHLSIARLRSIEEGLPLIRVANTGISTVVDPYGRILAALELGKVGVIDTVLPSSIPPTLYYFVRDSVFGLICVCFFGICVINRWSAASLLGPHSRCKRC
jgi:apolipoprotein N-acyltransferase